ncbi:hypothetical protein GGI14_003470 [Coemansia sp. S680]|nr:hypothetical protein GGI14_003470 [Coemansia sp. S680]
MSRQPGIGIIRQGSDGKGAGGSSYFQRRAQPLPTRQPVPPPPPRTSSSTSDKLVSPDTVKPGIEMQYGQNAIAVLTNHPNKAPTRIHRNELPAVPRTHYPKAKTSDFDSYLEATTALFEQYEANSRSGYQIAADELDRYEAAVDDAEKVLELASHTYSMDSTTMAERLKALDGTRSEFGLESVSEYGGGGGDTGGAKAASLPGIEDIPTIFFEDGFDLRDPAIFDIATQVVLGPQAATAELFAPEKSGNASAIMQESLSTYMDTVEAYLTREISRRSPSFFAALSTLEELHAETDRCIGKIHVLRNDLKKIAYAQCAPGLELVRMRRRRDNMAAVLGDVELLSNLRHVQPTVEELIGSGDCIGALNLITEAQDMIELPGPMPAKNSRREIAKTRAFKLLNARLLKSLHSVSSFAEQELAAIVLRDMREFVDDGLSSSSDGLLGRSQVDIYQVNLAMQLTPFICGLVRTGGIGNALKAYRDSLMSETAGLIESLYPSGFPRSRGHAMFNDATQQRILGTAVRGQTLDQFRTMLRQQQELLLLIISHVGMVRRAILEVLDENRPMVVEPESSLNSSVLSKRDASRTEPSPLPLSKRYDSAKAEVLRSLNDTFDSFMDVAHVRCAKLLNHRSEQNARLSLAGFHSLYMLIHQFIAQYESLGGKMCFGLRGTLTAQAKAFLGNFHTEKSRQIQILIENEQWAQAEVPIDFQNLVNQVVDAAFASRNGASVDDESRSPLLLTGNAGQPTAALSSVGASFASSPLALGFQQAESLLTRNASMSTSRTSMVLSPESPLSARSLDPAAGHPVAMLSRQDSDAASIRSVDTAGIGLMHIGDEAFHVVGCSLVLVKSVVEYLQCAVNIPMLATDVLQRLVEVLKSFNSRTCQVVLGAGAMRSAGLKNISAKHLALASESLSLCIELIPHVKECLRHVMSASQEVLLAQLDRVATDFTNHQSELHRKLVTIMTDRADYHARMLAATKWDDLDQAAQPPVAAMDGLVKEVRKLHKVLKRYLPPSSLRSVFAQIFTMYEEKLSGHYAKMRITSGEGKRQLMLNSQYLLRRLRALDPSLPVDWELEVVVNNIDLVKPYQVAVTSPAPASSPLPATGPSKTGSESSVETRSPETTGSEKE